MHKVSSDKRRDGLPKYIRLYADGREGGFVLVTASHPYDVKFTAGNCVIYFVAHLGSQSLNRTTPNLPAI